jgi:DNA-binding protein H-NS
MGLTDRLKDVAKKAEDAAAERKDQIRGAVHKAGAAADQRTGGKYSEQIQKAGAKADSVVDRIKDPDATPAAAEPAPDAAPGDGPSPGEGPPTAV